MRIITCASCRQLFMLPQIVKSCDCPWCGTPTTLVTTPHALEDRMIYIALPRDEYVVPGATVYRPETKKREDFNPGEISQCTECGKIFETRLIYSPEKGALEKIPANDIPGKPGCFSCAVKNKKCCVKVGDL